MVKKTKSPKDRKVKIQYDDLDKGYRRPAVRLNQINLDYIKETVLKNRFTAILSIIIIIGAFLRFYHLDFNSLWLDEAVTADFSNKSFLDIWNITAGGGGEYHPPLFYWLEHIMLSFGNNEITLRLVPAIVGILTIPLTYFAGKEFMDKRAGLIAAALIAFSPFHLFYSQEARSYTLMLFFVSLVFLFLLRGLKEPGARPWIFFGVFAAMALWAHFLTAIPLAIFWGFAIGYTWIKRWNMAEVKKKFKNILLSIAIFVVITLPLLVVTVRLFLAITATAPTYGIQGWPVISQSVLQMSGFNLAVTVFLLILFGTGLLVLYTSDIAKLMLILAFSIIPLVASVFLSYKMPMLPRYLIYLLPAYFIGIAASYRTIYSFFRSDKVAYGFAILFFLIQIQAGMNYYTAYSKEDWRGFSTVMQQIVKAQDVIVLAPAYMRTPFDYYYHNDSGTVKEMGANTLDELKKTRISRRIAPSTSSSPAIFTPWTRKAKWWTGSRIIQRFSGNTPGLTCSS